MKSRRLFAVLFYGLMVLLLVPLWAFTCFPTQDGPSHVYNAWLMLHLHDPALPTIGHYYTLNTLPSPNWIGHLLLAGLMLVVKPLVAEKIVLSAFLVGFVCAARYAVASLRPSATPLCLLAFPLGYNYFLHMGFYNFAYCLPLFLVVMGFYFRHRSAWTAGRVAALSGLALVLYFAHVSGVVMAIFAIGIDVVLRGFGGEGRESFLAGFLRRVGPVFVAFLPAVILTAVFLLRAPQADVSAAISDRMSLHDRVLFYPFSIVAYAKTDRALSATFFVVLFGAFGWAVLRGARRTQGGAMRQALVTLAAVGLSLVVPNNISQGGFVFQRVVIFVFLLAILTLATVQWRGRGLVVMQIMAAIMTVAGLAQNMVHYQRINGYLAELVSLAPKIPADHTLLYTISDESPKDAVGNNIAHPVHPFLHADCYLGLERGLVTVDNYEAVVGYFPVKYQPEIDYVHNIGGGATLRLTFPKGVPATVDYVVFFTAGSAVQPNPYNLNVQRQLAEDFMPVEISEPAGAATLYKARVAP